ncbi:MAG: transporter permease [Desulfomicrobiaceae bacterium]|jgi:branched-chain amino acid transport system permease protein|nr:branched-chain amino acid ABC transporter permease [Desulfomicrobiaceae bacterium]MBZ4648439.1 transporter permease [Desulfomicrobiaceae bacterium]MBZ4684421.1 transporter permease [Desulfomicrobiaceae bacterium]MDK2873026.1 branched-chain amino acid transport system permease protein [Desulfomicrobiaceae bacterium]
MKRYHVFALNFMLVGVLAALLACAQRFLDGYSIQILNLVAINILLALSLNLIYGFTGMFSLGHAGFMAIGAYVCAILILSPDQKAMLFLLEPAYPWIESAHAPFVVAVFAGGLAAAAMAAVVGFPLLRLGDDYLGIATLGFAEIVRVVANNVPRITNGALGFKGIPAYANLWWNYGWCLLALVLIVRILRSNTGRCFKAIRDDEVAARAMGVNVFRLKLLSFSLGAFFAGVGGGLLASLLTTIDPKMFLFVLTFNVLMIVVMGGLGSVTGSVIAGAAVTIILEWLRFVEDPITLGSVTLPGIPGMRMVVFSLLLIAVILFRREGLMGTREISWEGIAAWLRQRRKA